MNRSFMHLHLGFDARDLEDLELHHIVVNSWDGGVDAEQVRPYLIWRMTLFFPACNERAAGPPHSKLSCMVYRGAATCRW
jgi:hypothetical protein